MRFVHRPIQLLSSSQWMSGTWIGHPLWNVPLPCAAHRLFGASTHLSKRKPRHLDSILSETCSRSIDRRTANQIIHQFLGTKVPTGDRCLRNDWRNQSNRRFVSTFGIFRKNHSSLLHFGCSGVFDPLCDKCKLKVAIDQFHIVNCAQNHSVCLPCYEEHVKYQVKSFSHPFLSSLDCARSGKTDWSWPVTSARIIYKTKTWQKFEH